MCGGSYSTSGLGALVFYLLPVLHNPYGIVLLVLLLALVVFTVLRLLYVIAAQLYSAAFPHKKISALSVRRRKLFGCFVGAIAFWWIAPVLEMSGLLFLVISSYIVVLVWIWCRCVQWDNVVNTDSSERVNTQQQQVDKPRRNLAQQRPQDEVVTH